MARPKSKTKFRKRYDSSKHNEGGGFTPLPNGQYFVKATEGNFKESNAKDGSEYLELIFEVQKGEFKGRKIWKLFNLYNINPQAVTIAEEELKHYIIQAFGFEMKVKDAKELLGKPVLANIVVIEQDGYKPKNEINSFESTKSKKGKNKDKKTGKKTGKKKNW